jgi:hypothetical protein
MFLQRFRTPTITLALIACSTTAAFAEEFEDAPSDCPETVVGTTSGLEYDLTGQAERTETQTGSMDVKPGGVGAGEERTYTTTYNVGYYTREDGVRVEVNCSTMKVIR